MQLVDDAVFCVHGGLSPILRTVDQIQTLERVQEIPNEGPYSDLMWSDPEDTTGWAVSPRGAGFLFGSQATLEVFLLSLYMCSSFSFLLLFYLCLSCSTPINHLMVLYLSYFIPQFTHNNGIELVCRAHQLVMEGYKYHFPERNLVTVWSAPNYCYRCGNVASILALNDRLERDFKLFHEVAEPETSLDVQRRQLVPYFM